MHDATEENWHDAPDSSEHSQSGKQESALAEVGEPVVKDTKPTSSARTLHVSRVAHKAARRKAQKVLITTRDDERLVSEVLESGKEAH